MVGLGITMEWRINEFGDVGMQLILPLFEGVSKAPNKSLDGMNRKQRSLVRSAISSKDFEGKRGQRLSVWTEGCRVLLICLLYTSDAADE